MQDLKKDGQLFAPYSVSQLIRIYNKSDHKNYLLFLSELRTGNLRLITFSSLRVTIATGCVPSFGMSKRTYWVSLLKDSFNEINAFCPFSKSKI